MGNVYSQNAVAKYLENSSILKARLKVVFNFLFVIAYADLVMAEIKSQHSHALISGLRTGHDSKIPAARASAV